jgi:ABC-type antimicrobial peptide transport system permease subunit
MTSRLRSWALGGVASPTFPLPESEYSGMVVVASDLSSIHTVRSEIALLGYATTAPEHLIASVQKYLHVVDIVLGGVGVIALVIAVLGIANSLLVAVRERRQQIGVLKAIGARDLDVVRWFIVEAAIIGLIGGTVGTGLGLAVAFSVGVQVNDYLLAQGLAGIDFGGIPAGIVLLGIAGSSLLALVAGALPAWRAARLPAREALNAP